MTAPLDIPTLVRPAFFDGQRLGAADVTAIYTFHRTLRELHNRGLHGWGIALGFVVTGRKGAREVTVSPGYALDCEGHDLVLAAAVTLPVPPIAASPSGGPMRYYLTAAYATDDDLAASETREGVCHPSGAVRRLERPRIRWQNPLDTTDPASRYRRGLDLILATVEIEGCVLARDASAAERRSVRPAPQPYVASGQTAIGQTAWRFYPASTMAAVEAVVDTSAAGFRATPAYFAQLGGSRALPNGTIVDGFVAVVSPAPQRMTVRVVLPRNLQLPAAPLNPNAAFSTALPDQLRTTLGWHVTWIGVES